VISEWSEHTRDGLWPGKSLDLRVIFLAKDHHSCVLPTRKSHLGGFMYLSHAKISQGFVKYRLKITSETKEWQKITLKLWIIW
jgi:hypothetical protein